jgi:putative transposase
VGDRAGRCHVDGAGHVRWSTEEIEIALSRSPIQAGAISCAVPWYFLCQLNSRDIKELLFEREAIVTYETIRRWCDAFS